METINTAIELNRAISPLMPQLQIAVKIVVMTINAFKKG